jgi:hypothetical protein
MVSFSVTATVHFSLECSAADVAGERLVASMLSGVCDQVRGLGEALSTDSATVRLLASMDISMLLHITLLMEPLPAEFTRIGSSIGMNE